MKLRTVKTYQSVDFNKKNETHFDIRLPRYKDISLELDKDAKYVTIKMPGAETVLVFATNIAYVVALPEEPKKSSKQ